MSAHALLSASGSERWLNCPPSARMEEGLPDTESQYAAEGTLAHKLVELKMRLNITKEINKRQYNKELKLIEADPLYDREMQGYTDAFIEYVDGVMMRYPSSPMVSAERRVDFSHVVPDGFGTADCIIVYGDTIHVIDFKYGKGVPVNAEKNSQMMLYALGALEHYRIFYDLKKAELAIIQPRLNNVSEWTEPINELQDWAETEAKPKAKLAFAGGSGDPNPGKWCKFCKVRFQCRQRTGIYTALEEFGFKKPPLLEDAEVGDILKRAHELRTWVADLEEYALRAVLDGKEIPGWKAVEGRSVRQFTDVDEAFKAVVGAGYDEALLYERKPVTLTAVEKLLGKKGFDEILTTFIHKPPGKPTLAPTEDSRPIYSSAAADFKEGD